MKIKNLIAKVLAFSVMISTVSGYGAYTGPVFAASIRADVGTEFTDTVSNAGLCASGNTDVIFTYKFTSVDSGTAEVALIGAETKDNNTLTGFTVQTYVTKKGAEDYTDSRGKAFSSDSIKVTSIDLDGKKFSSTDQIHSVNMNHAASNLTSIKIKNFDYCESANSKLSLGISGSDKFRKLKEVDFSGSHVRFDSSSKDDNIALLIEGCEETLKSISLANLADGNDNYNGEGGVNTDLDLRKFTALTYVDVSGNVGLESLSISPDVYANKSYTLVNISGDKALSSLNAQASGKNVKKYRENNPGLNQGIRFITDGGTEGSSVLDLSDYSMRTIDVEYAGLTGFKAPEGKNGNGYIADLSHNYIRSVDLSKGKGTLTSLNLNENQLMDIDLSGQVALSSLRADKNFLTSIDISPATALTGLSLTDNYIPSSAFKKDSSQSSRTLSEQKDLTSYFTLSGDAGMISTSDDEKAFVDNNGNAKLYVLVAVLGAPEGFAKKLSSTITWEEKTKNDGAVTLNSAGITSATDRYIPELNGYESIVVAYTGFTGNSSQKAGEIVTANFGGDRDTISIASDDIYTLSRDMTSNIGANAALMPAEVKISSVFDYGQLAQKVGSSGAKFSITADNPAGKLDSYSEGMGKALYTALASSLSKEAAAKACKVGIVNLGYSFKEYQKDGSKVNKDVSVTNNEKITAVYNQSKYSINFSSNGGSGSQDTLKDKLYSDKISIPGCSFTNNNGTFLGWVRDKAPSKEGDFARLYEKDDSEYQIVTPTKSSTNMHAIWESKELNMSLETKTATLTLGDPGSVINVADLKPVVKDENGLSYGQYDGNTKSKITSEPKFAYLSADENIVSYNDNGAFYPTGAGTAKIFVYDTANSRHAVGTVTVTVKGKTTTSSSDKKEDKDSSKTKNNSKTKTDSKTKTNTKTKTTKTDNDDEDTDNIVVKGSTYSYSGSDLILEQGAEVASLTIDTVTVDGKKLKVVGIAANAFKDNETIKKVVIGENVKSVGQTAFLRCKDLKTIVIESKNLLKGATVGKNAFKSIHKKATIKINSTVYDKTKKVIDKKAGVADTVKFKKL